MTKGRLGIEGYREAEHIEQFNRLEGPINLGLSTRGCGLDHVGGAQPDHLGPVGISGGELDPFLGADDFREESLDSDLPEPFAMEIPEVALRQPPAQRAIE